MWHKMSAFKIGAFVAVVGLGSYFVYSAWFSPDGSTQLSWAPPTGNESEESADDLAGYVIHCWSETRQHTSTVYVDDPTVTSYEVKRLWPGDYFCAVTAVNSDGSESALSNVLATTVK
ncbi:MAG: hypothetical protein AMS22_10000 [Thiotrichales bacterium SG8_50]|nr:MAG: hypothetical protein AMS22_10000 [Thiotrichales bacterium SG8_50]